MTDPTGGAGSGVAKMAEEAVREMRDAMKEVENLSSTHKADGAQFQQVMEVQNLQNVREVGGVQQTSGTLDVLRAATQSQRTQVSPIGQSLDTKSTMGQNGLQRIMGEVMDGQEGLEKIMRYCMSGKNFDYSQLLGLQVRVYQLTQELELVSKLVEKGTSSIKQTLNTQV